MAKSLKYIPGLTTTKGEPGVMKALQNVHAKITELEKEKQTAELKLELFSSKENADKETLSKLRNAHATTESQYKLLELQLRHLRHHLQPHLDNVIWDDSTNKVERISTPQKSYKSNYFSRRTISVPPETLRSSPITELEKQTEVKRPRDYNKKSTRETELPVGPREIPEDLCLTSTSAPSFSESSSSRKEFISEVDLKSLHSRIEAIKNSSKHKTNGKVPRFTKGRKEAPAHHYGKHTIRTSKGKDDSSDIPFILGRSTTASHSLPANIQNILSLLKTENRKFLSFQYDTDFIKGKRKCAESALSDFTKVMKKYGNGLKTTREEIKELIHQLEGEKSELLQAYEKCENIIINTTNSLLKNELSPELEILNRRLEAKRSQIERLYTLLQVLGSESRRKQYRVQTTTLQKDKPGSIFVTTEIITGPSSKTFEVKTTTTKVSKGIEPSKDLGINSSRLLLQELRNIQQTLQKDNVY